MISISLCWDRQKKSSILWDWKLFLLWDYFSESSDFFQEYSSSEKNFPTFRQRDFLDIELCLFLLKGLFGLKKIVKKIFSWIHKYKSIHLDKKIPRHLTIYQWKTLFFSRKKTIEKSVYSEIKMKNMKEFFIKKKKSNNRNLF